MPEVREIMAMITALTVVSYVVVNRARVLKIPYWRLMVASLACLTLSLTCSVIESFVGEHLLNLVQHSLGGVEGIAALAATDSRRLPLLDAADKVL